MRKVAILRGKGRIVTAPWTTRGRMSVSHYWSWTGAYPRGLRDLCCTPKIAKIGLNK